MRRWLAVAALLAAAGTAWALRPAPILRIEDLEEIARIEPTLPGAPNLIAATELLPAQVARVCSLGPYAEPARFPEEPGLAGTRLERVPEGGGAVRLSRGGWRVPRP